MIMRNIALLVPIFFITTLSACQKNELEEGVFTKENKEYSLKTPKKSSDEAIYIGNYQKYYSENERVDNKPIELKDLYYLDDSDNKLIHYQPKNAYNLNHLASNGLNLETLIKEGGDKRLYYFNGYVYLQIHCEKIECPNYYNVSYSDYEPLSYNNFIKYKYAVREKNSTYHCGMSGCFGSGCTHFYRSDDFPVKYHKL